MRCVSVRSHLVHILIVSVGWLSRSSVVVVCGGGVSSLLATSTGPLGSPGTTLGHGGAQEGEG